MSLQFLPIEIHCEISKYLNYEDIIALSNYLEISPDKILSFVNNIQSEKTYFPKDAPRIKLTQLNININEVHDSILISIDSPDEFLTLQKFSKLKQANFILPHNKYESITEFEEYLNSFFEAISKRKTDLLYKELRFRLLYSSDFNPYLGIVMEEGFIELINSDNFVGFDEDVEGHMTNIDFLVDIVKKKIDGIPIFYDLAEDYIFESGIAHNYIECDIIPICINSGHNNREGVLIHELTGIQKMYEDDEWLQKITLDDYLVVLVEFRNKDILPDAGCHLTKLFQIASEEDPISYNEGISNNCLDSIIFEKRLINCFKYIIELLNIYTEVYKHDYKLKRSFQQYTFEQLLQRSNESLDGYYSRIVSDVCDILKIYDPPNPKGMPNYMYYKLTRNKTEDNPYYITNLSDEDTVEWNVSDNEDE